MPFASSSVIQEIRPGIRKEINAQVSVAPTANAKCARVSFALTWRPLRTLRLQLEQHGRMPQRASAQNLPSPSQRPPRRTHPPQTQLPAASSETHRVSASLRPPRQLELPAP